MAGCHSVRAPPPPRWRGCGARDRRGSGSPRPPRSRWRAGTGESTSDHRGPAIRSRAGGHLTLTLEMGSFPRKRFALQALLYLPEPRRPRDAAVTTAEPTAHVELVPDLPGALGLGRGSSLNSGDVLEGVLRIKDSLTEREVERRPRRLVLVPRGRAVATVDREPAGDAGRQRPSARAPGPGAARR